MYRLICGGRKRKERIKQSEVDSGVAEQRG
jgi:hypothetical protein